MASMAGVTDLGGGGRLAVKPFPMDGKSYDEVDVVEIKQLYCNTTDAEDRDEIFPNEALPVELLVTFWEDAVEHLRDFMQLLDAYRRDKKLRVDAPGNKIVDLEFQLKHHCHATKGSAANLGVWRISIASRRLELDLVQMINAIPDSTEDERRKRLEGYLFEDGGNVREYWNRMLEFTLFLANKELEKDLLGYINEEICDMGLTFEEVPAKAPEEFEPAEDWEANEEEFRECVAEFREKVHLKGFVDVMKAQDPPAWIGKPIDPPAAATAAATGGAAKQQEAEAAAAPQPAAAAPQPAAAAPQPAAAAAQPAAAAPQPAAAAPQPAAAAPQPAAAAPQPAAAAPQPAAAAPQPAAAAPQPAAAAQPGVVAR